MFGKISDYVAIEFCMLQQILLSKTINKKSSQSYHTSTSFCSKSPLTNIVSSKYLLTLFLNCKI